MRDPRRTFVRLIAVLTLCSTVAFAQTKPKPAPKALAPAPRATTTPVRSDPFVGVWQLSAEKSKYESGGAPKGFTRTYEDRGDGTIFMTTDVVTAQGTTRSYLVYKRDGKPYPEAALGVESIRLVMVKAIDRYTEAMAFTVSGKPAGQHRHDHGLRLGRWQNDDAGAQRKDRPGAGVHEHPDLRQTIGRATRRSLGSGDGYWPMPLCGVRSVSAAAVALVPPAHGAPNSGVVSGLFLYRSMNRCSLGSAAPSSLIWWFHALATTGLAKPVYGLSSMKSSDAALLRICT